MKQSIIIVIGTLFLLTSCIDSSKNTVGFVGSGITPTKITIPDSCFTNQFSFQDTTENYSNNTLLFIGNNGNKKATILLKLTNLPDSIAELSHFRLSFPLNKNNITLPSEFSYGKINQKWDENQATGLKATEDENWNNPNEISTAIFSSDNYTIENDSLVFDFGNEYLSLLRELLNTWISADSLNNGLSLSLDEVVYPDNEPNYLELHSSENVVQPHISFTYRTIKDTVDVTYFKVPAYDTFIIKEEISTNPINILKISNISPTRMFFKFNLPQNLFPGINSGSDYQKMTINKAELVLKTETNDKYLTDHSFSFYSYLITKENPELPISTEDYISLSGSIVTTDSLEYNKELRINITPIIQAFTSGDKDNYGIIIKSLKEGKNFDNIDFQNDNLKLDIIFTKPNLDN
jgi:hypothetical protein